MIDELMISNIFMISINNKILFKLNKTPNFIIASFLYYQKIKTYSVSFVVNNLC